MKDEKSCSAFRINSFLDVVMSFTWISRWRSVLFDGWFVEIGRHALSGRYLECTCSTLIFADEMLPASCEGTVKCSLLVPVSLVLFLGPVMTGERNPYLGYDGK